MHRHLQLDEAQHVILKEIVAAMENHKHWHLCRLKRIPLDNDHQFFERYPPFD